MLYSWRGVVTEVEWLVSPDLGIRLPNGDWRYVEIVLPPALARNRKWRNEVAKKMLRREYGSLRYDWLLALEVDIRADTARLDPRCLPSLVGKRIVPILESVESLGLTPVEMAQEGRAALAGLQVVPDADEREYWQVLVVTPPICSAGGVGRITMQAWETGGHSPGIDGLLEAVESAIRLKEKKKQNPDWLMIALPASPAALRLDSLLRLQETDRAEARSALLALRERSPFCEVWVFACDWACPDDRYAVVRVDHVDAQFGSLEGP